MHKTLTIILIALIVILAGVLIWQNLPKNTLEQQNNNQVKSCVPEGEIVGRLFK